MNNNIDMAILMGGKSSRMARPKAYLEYHGKTFFDVITSELEKCGDVYISIDKNEKMRCKTHYAIIEDMLDSNGPIVAIYSLLKAIKNDYLFVVACDMPFIRENYINFLISKIENDTQGIFAVGMDGKVETMAAVYSKKMLPQIEEGIKEGKRKLLDVINLDKCVKLSKEELEKKFLNVFLNINTIDEYNKYTF